MQKRTRTAWTFFTVGIVFLLVGITMSEWGFVILGFAIGAIALDEKNNTKGTLEDTSRDIE